MTFPSAVLLAAALALSGCDSLEPGGGGGSSDLDGAWRLAGGTHGGDPIPLVDAAPITMTIEGAEIGGVAACNHYGGEILVDGQDVRIASVTMTEMGCDGPMMESESAYLAALGDVARFERANGTLTFSGEVVELTYELVPPTPDADMAGTAWRLDALVDGDAVSSTMGEPATLELRDDGTLSGHTGCRTFDGRYERDGGEVRVTDLVNDDRACPDLARQDEHVLSVIGDGFAYAIDGDRLILTDGDLGLVYLVAGE
jgi:heat shock protein HslJ